MDVIIAINSQYVDMCKTMLYSLLRHNRHNNIVIHIFNKNLEDDLINELGNFIQQNGGAYKIYELMNIPFENVNLSLKRFSIEMFFRILAYKILPESISRVLWLDSDLIIRGDLSAYYNQSFDGKDLIVCKDAYYQSEFIKQIKNNMDLPESHDYFNSGVILFNLDNIRSRNINEMLISIIDKYNEKWMYPDQDILNKLFYNEVKYCDERIYNFQVNEIYRADLTDILILHYAGVRKPWLPFKAYPISLEYWKVRALLGDWFGVIEFGIIYLLLYLPKAIKRGIKKCKK